MDMLSIVNLITIDIFLVGIAVAANLILGFMVFFRNTKSATGILFLLLTIIISSWGVVNYVSYQVENVELALLLVRLVMFLAAPMGGLFLLLVANFPYDELHTSRHYVLLIVLSTATTMILALSPFLFTSIELVPNMAPRPSVGIGIISFIITPALVTIFGLIMLFRKMLIVSGVERLQFRYLFFGVILMFIAIIVFNFVLAAFFKNTRFIPLGSLFTFPFVIFTAYAIVKHHLLNVKVIATEVLTFLLAVITFFEVIIAQDTGVLVFRIIIFSGTLILGIILIKSVLKEVEQREKLEVLNEKLKQLDKLKSEFLSFASHQVKSPMSVVKGYASLIFDGTYGVVSDKVKEIAQKIKESADKMIALVNNLLDLRKIEEGKMEYKFEQADITSVVKTVVDGLLPLAQAKNLSLTFESETEGAKAKLDVQKFTQVIQNLVDNAIKYTETGWIKIRMNYDNEKKNILITVSDSGRGMSKELLPRLFEQFTRDSGVRKLIQGTGLGLYIAKQIILAHQGNITAYSEGEGKGSEFVVRIGIDDNINLTSF